MEAVLSLDPARRDCFCTWRTTRPRLGAHHRVLALSAPDGRSLFVVANRVHLGPRDEVVLGAAFASCQGLAAGAALWVEEAAALASVVPAARMEVAPESDADWELLAANQELLVASFLAQCCCVWPGMRLPLWVGGSLLTVRVSPALRPPFAVVREMSEVLVAPPQSGPSDGSASKSALEAPEPSDNVPLASGASSGGPGEKGAPRAVLPARRGPLAVLASLMDFVHFLWRGHTLSCRREMDLLAAEWRRSVGATEGALPTVCRLREEPALGEEMPMLLTGAHLPFGVALARVLPLRCGQTAVPEAPVEMVLPVWPAERPCEPGHTLASAPALRLLGAAPADVVALSPLRYEGRHLRRVTLAGAGAPPEVRGRFLAWLRRRWSEGRPLVLWRGLELRPDGGAPLVVDLQFASALGAPEPPFGLLSPRMVAAGFVRLQVASPSAPESGPEAPLPPVPPGNATEAPLPAQPLESSLERRCRAALLEGRTFGAVVSGGALSGRSLLLRHVAAVLGQEPGLQAPCQWLACREWRARPLERFRKAATAAARAAEWRRPSVLVLDDLDALLAPQPERDGDEARALAFADLLRALLHRRPGLALLASVHESAADCVSPLADLALFDVWLDVPLMDEALVRRVLLPQCVPEPGSFDLAAFERRLGRSLSAFGVGELKLLLERDVYATGSQQQQQAVGSSADSAGYDATAAQQQQAVRGSADSADYDAADEQQQQAVGGSADSADYDAAAGQQQQPRGLNRVAGLQAAKRELTRAVVWARRYPELFRACPLRPVRGALLYGPPGSGKTLLARSLAEEAGLALIQVRGPELLSKYIGASEANVREAFARASRAAPSLLLFDDFDALAPRRGHDSTGVTDRVVNQLLTELDGAQARRDGVFVLAASNRPELIDAALLRPGRLDLRLACHLPDARARAEAVALLAAPGQLALRFAGDEAKLAAVVGTEGFSGADLRSLLLAARVHSLRRRGLWDVRRAWDGDGVRAPLGRAAGAVEVAEEDVAAARAKVAAAFGPGRERQRAAMEAAMATGRGEAADADRQRVTLA